MRSTRHHSPPQLLRSVLNLFRYDLGQIYSINSVNRTDCYNRTVTGGTARPPWPG